MKKRLLAFGCLSLLLQNAWAADLLEAWSSARKTDAVFSAARNGLLAGREKAAQGDALLLPKLSLAGNAGRANSEFDPEKPTSTSQSYNRNGNSYGYSLSLTQPVYRIEALAGADQLRKQTALAEIQYRQAESDLIQRVAKAYFDVVLAEEKIRQIAAQKEAVSQQLAQAKLSFEVGVATITDVDAAQASYDGLLSQEIAALNDREVKYQAFEQLTGLKPQTLAPVSDKLQPGMPEPATVDPWLKRADEGNFTLLSQRLNLEIARREVDKYKMETAPGLDLVASYGSKWESASLTKTAGVEKTATGQIMLQLSVPLYTGGNRSSQFREAIAKQDQQRDNVEAARRDTVLSTRKAFLGVQSGAAQIKALQQSLNSSKSLVDSTTLGKEVGVRTIVDVLNAQQQYYSTRYDLTSARCNYLLSRLQLAAAVGDLGEKDLEEVAGWLAK
ncbi:outer membrane protein [Formivibrio citricus]|uniref:Outer membrane protein n=1 Tax=Formivibrio citricus TaxID=83765 RepID=A0A1I4VUG4_9NEIS|nr:TolC family outer membrane protein [Formivibrio citricus]SFN04833.1 outer membrane protein [Formivibrio citricus]